MHACMHTYIHTYTYTCIHIISTTAASEIIQKNIEGVNACIRIFVDRYIHSTYITYTHTRTHELTTSLCPCTLDTYTWL